MVKKTDIVLGDRSEKAVSHFHILTDNIFGAGLNINQFAELTKSNPKSIIELRDSNKKASKHLLIISALLKEMRKANIDFKKVINDIEKKM